MDFFDMIVLLIIFSGFMGVICLAVGGVLSAVRRAPLPSIVLLIIGSVLSLYSGFYIIGADLIGGIVLAVILLYDILFAIRNIRTIRRRPGYAAEPDKQV